MERIALIIGNYVIYWRPLLMVAAVLVTACLFSAIYLQKGGSGLSALATVCTALVLGTFLARLLHWYCRFDSYPSLRAAITEYSTGGYALAGVFAGCLAAALLLRLLFVHRNTPMMLDCMAIAGSAGIAVGRLASFFDASDRGPILQTLRDLPFAYPVTNPVSGAVEYRLAVFLIQAMIAAALFAVLLVLYFLPRKKKLPDGDVTLIFLLIYGATQVVMDSIRYDSLFFRSNGFVSVVQVLGAAGLVIPTVIFAVRMVLRQGMKRKYCILWLVILGLIGLGGYMEYFVQRHGSQAFLGYCIMSSSIAAAVILSLMMHRLSLGSEESIRSGRFLKTE